MQQLKRRCRLQQRALASTVALGLLVGLLLMYWPLAARVSSEDTLGVLGLTGSRTVKVDPLPAPTQRKLAQSLSEWSNIGRDTQDQQHWP